MKREIYEFQEVVAIPPKPFSEYERDGFSVYGLSKLKDVVTLKLRREVTTKKASAR